MSTRQRKELNVAKGSACSCSYPSWKPTFHAMATKVSQTTSWVLLRSLPWAQHKRWIPIRSMEYVHTHWGRPGIEGCDNLKHIWSDVEKIGENNQKVGKIGRTISQMFTLGPKHDKIRAQLASSILSKSMDRSKKCSYVKETLEGGRWCECHL